MAKKSQPERLIESLGKNINKLVKDISVKKLQLKEMRYKQKQAIKNLKIYKKRR